MSDLRNRPSQRGPAAAPVRLDLEKIDAAALALLSLTLHDGIRAWKGLDWDIMGRLHAKGYIEDPVDKSKSVMFTDEGRDQAERLLVELFGVK